MTEYNWRVGDRCGSEFLNSEGTIVHVSPNTSEVCIQLDGDEGLYVEEIGDLKEVFSKEAKKIMSKAYDMYNSFEEIEDFIERLYKEGMLIDFSGWKLGEVDNLSMSTPPLDLAEEVLFW